MVALDMRTVMVVHVVVHLVGLVVMLALWRQNRLRYNGLAFWATAFSLQLGGVSLIALRGILPKWSSVVLGNAMIIGGVLVIFFGLRRFAAKKTNPLLVYALLAYFAIFLFVHAYFTFASDQLPVRRYNATFGMALGGLLCMWVMLRETSRETRHIYRPVGIAYGIFMLVNIGRIVGTALLPDTNNDFLASGLYDTMMVILTAGSVVIITISLVLTVNSRLLADVDTLSGLIPICAWCKKIRDDKAYWQSIESYISARSSAEFTHSICPECQKKHFSTA